MNIFFPLKETKSSIFQDVELPAKAVGCPLPPRHGQAAVHRPHGARHLHGETFLAARPAKGEEGTFRFVLTGLEKVKLRFPVNKVLASGLFAGMVAEAEVDIRDHIKPEKNSVCSKGMDVLELVQSQDMLILDGLGEDASEEFIAAMARFKKDVLQETGSMDRASISFRWLVGTLKGQTEVLLMAQGRNICNSRNPISYFRIG